MDQCVLLELEVLGKKNLQLLMQMNTSLSIHSLLIGRVRV
jgi:hypothetical protein